MTLLFIAKVIRLNTHAVFALAYRYLAPLGNFEILVVAHAGQREPASVERG